MEWNMQMGAKGDKSYTKQKMKKEKVKQLK